MEAMVCRRTSLSVPRFPVLHHGTCLLVFLPVALRGSPLPPHLSGIGLFLSLFHMLTMSTPLCHAHSVWEKVPSFLPGGPGVLTQLEQ